jgi:hypothetical protein
MEIHLQTQHDPEMKISAINGPSKEPEVEVKCQFFSNVLIWTGFQIGQVSKFGQGRKEVSKLKRSIASTDE